MTAVVVLATSCTAGTKAFVHLAEGYGGSGSEPFLSADPRVFTASEDYCSDVPPVSRLGVDGPAVVKVGRPLLLREFEVEARGLEGQLVERVPVEIQISEQGADRLDRTLFQESGKMVFRSPGRVGLLVRALCQPTEVSRTYTFRVEP